MTMEQEQPLFDIEPILFDQDRDVVVQTIWGDEVGRIVDYDIHGLVCVRLRRGDTITISIARLKQAHDG